MTLRDKPLPLTPQRQHLTDSLKAAGPLHSLSSILFPEDKTETIEPTQILDRPSNVGLLDEVNLLEGLPIGMLDTVRVKEIV